jgi:hypothetical protein
MNLMARKLNLIEELLHIHDDGFITRIEAFIKQEKRNAYEVDLEPMSMSEFTDIIDKAKVDCAEGRVISHQDLTEKVKSWK